MADEEISSKPFSAANTRDGFRCVPDRYVVPPSQHPGDEHGHESATIPVIDVAAMRRLDDDRRATVIREIGAACRRFGFFQVVNHGIPEQLMDGALSVANEFFQLPTSERNKLKSSDVREPVRYSTSIKDGIDSVQYWRIFLKHYAHPLHHWIHLWPTNPPHYREGMGKYCQEARKLALELMEAITDSLGLSPSHLSNKMEDGMQVMAINCYPPCPNPDMTLGLPPHSDYGCLTVVLQGSEGLEIKDQEDGKWKLVPDLKGALQVHIGDHLEVLSNGLYRSVVHRAVLSSERTRISIASLHSLGMDEQMGPAKELVETGRNPMRYKESSFRDFLDFLSKNDIVEGRFIDTLVVKE